MAFVRFAFPVALLLALPACAGTPPRHSDPMPPSRMTCNADAAQWAIGQQATTDIVERIRSDSRSRVVRMLHPGQMVTMEFSAERVDIRVDGNNGILAVTCG
ncbi:I78 family peptidase inhibitor [Cognatiluteimonas profundi]|uniref:I78 family peptidase inhibitor n=1 Tax=Cognatiluteimonas profundi TaxID=2594501 RepID=UPI00131B5B2B|nr:I78 family peptidase inhibitor [Lysobacter profundi]